LRFRPLQPSRPHPRRPLPLPRHRHRLSRAPSSRHPLLRRLTRPLLLPSPHRRRLPLPKRCRQRSLRLPRRRRRPRHRLQPQPQPRGRGLVGQGASTSRRSLRISGPPARRTTDPAFAARAPTIIPSRCAREASTLIRSPFFPYRGGEAGWGFSYVGPPGVLSLTRPAPAATVPPAAQPATEGDAA